MRNSSRIPQASQTQTKSPYSNSKNTTRSSSRKWTCSWKPSKDRGSTLEECWVCAWWQLGGVKKRQGMISSVATVPILWFRQGRKILGSGNSERRGALRLQQVIPEDVPSRWDTNQRCSNAQRSIPPWFGSQSTCPRSHQRSQEIIARKIFLIWTQIT